MEIHSYIITSQLRSLCCIVLVTFAEESVTVLYQSRMLTASVASVAMRCVQVSEDLWTSRTLSTFQTFPRDMIHPSLSFMNDGSAYATEDPRHLADDTGTTAISGGWVQCQELNLGLCMMSNDRRFGFSVVGGVGEGVPPRVDDIQPVRRRRRRLYRNCSS
ncbi:uncharacterized protein LOC110837834 isoform X2 [Zootermopsis nevadensis]|uniref:uncharacterized protein LOC110837834 isoform X2 n=1 Tax=Zootermopsis nevadensis TaxID=136037 RepID=UPI000B8EDBC0|nr:uncharacterized protein LOC110837834 isoform X2 [Zootermopsis nevadensis]